MASIARNICISKTLNNITKLLGNITLQPNVISSSVVICKPRIYCSQHAFLHVTSKQNDLMEFFDHKDNWSEKEVKAGRPWFKSELRLKSNEDLHKLWFVLLKERNMLLTMEHAYNERFANMPSPERRDKVEKSMENLETVVRERNQAYHLLETGETGERPAKYVYNALGMRFFYRMTQHRIPKFMNKKWFKTHHFGFGGYAVRTFLRKYNEKQNNKERTKQRGQERYVLRLMQQFPNMDMDAVKKYWPDVDIEKLRNKEDIRGHFVPQ
ncbi:39S ribosomal protein L47, mitochondrial [Cephus cinctus]|uniref:Large ribosomal subunit protein uL29m n=1 Tax=Cephus cinctus TaxID=211228 RepID=A0AAJ7CDI4_CEPCN|nr:39S ribosomal protein L47, mitochondrial [Cephus cinctus]